MDHTPFFTIIIPALNEEKYLPLLLKDLANQSYSEFEVIVVDGNSEDKTVKKAQEFEKKIDIHVVHAKKRNVSHQRNLGARLAKSNWLIFMDADDRLPDYFLDGIRYQLAKNKKIDLFTCWAKSDDDSPGAQMIATVFNLGIELYLASGKPAASGSLIGIKKEIFDKTEFPEDQKVAEDVFMVQSAIKKGHHFEILREPTYTYSFRRIKKEGNLKMAKTVAAVQWRLITGQDFAKKNYGYVMEGGNYYEDLKHVRPLHQLQEFLESSSKKQLQQARKNIQKILKEINFDL